MWATVAVAAITALSTGAVVLAVQLINSNYTLNTKRIEILFGRKADAYKALLERAGEFGIEPKDAEKYLVFQSSLHAALIVSSNEVAEILDGNPRISLHMNAVRLRMAKDQDEIQRYQMNEWYHAMEAVKLAMRSDVTRLSEPETLTLRTLWRALMGPRPA